MESINLFELFIHDYMESIWIYSYQMQAVEAMRRSREADEAEMFWRNGGTSREEALLKNTMKMRKFRLQPGRKLQHFFTFYFFWVEIECIDTTIRWNAVWIARGFKVTLCSTFVVGGHLTFKRVTWTIWTILKRSNKCKVFFCCWHFLLTKLCKVLTKIEKHGCKMIELTGSLMTTASISHLPRIETSKREYLLTASHNKTEVIKDIITAACFCGCRIFMGFSIDPTGFSWEAGTRAGRNISQSWKFMSSSNVIRVSKAKLLDGKDEALDAVWIISNAVCLLFMHFCEGRSFKSVVWCMKFQSFRGF